MEQHYQIGEAARRAGVTVETLRHYDRIGLVTPSQVDPQSGYRYYTDAEIDQVQVIRYLRSIRFSLPTIKKLFSKDDLPAAVETLQLACQQVDKEIESLQMVKRHLQETLDNYSTKRNTRRFIQPLSDPAVQTLPEQRIFLAQSLREPTLGSLSQLYSAIEGQLPPDIRPQFQFENAAGVLIREGRSVLFARCVCSVPHPNVTVLPAGRYLCLSCRTQEYRQTVEQLRRLAASRYQVRDSLVVLDVIFTGLVQWEYEVKLFLGPEA